MRRFGILLASAALGATLAASGPVAAMSSSGGGFGGFHGGGGHGGWGHGLHHGWHNGWGRNCWGGNCGWGWAWGGGWRYPYRDNAYSGYNYPGADYSYSTGYAAAPLWTGGSVATAKPGHYCIISVKTCQLHNPSFVGSDCSCKVPGGATSDVP